MAMKKMLRDLLLSSLILALVALALDDSDNAQFEGAGKDGVMSNE